MRVATFFSSSITEQKEHLEEPRFQQGQVPTPPHPGPSSRGNRPRLLILSVSASHQVCRTEPHGGHSTTLPPWLGRGPNPCCWPSRTTNTTGCSHGLCPGLQMGRGASGCRAHLLCRGEQNGSRRFTLMTASQKRVGGLVCYAERGAAGAPNRMRVPEPECAEPQGGQHGPALENRL